MATEEVKSDGSASGVRIFTLMELLREREREQKPAFDRPPHWAFDCHPIEEKPPQMAFDRPPQLAFDRPPQSLFKPMAFDRPPQSLFKPMAFDCPPQLAFDRPPMTFDRPPPMTFDCPPLEKQQPKQTVSESAEATEAAAPDCLKAMAKTMGIRIFTLMELEREKLPHFALNISTEDLDRLEAMASALGVTILSPRDLWCGKPYDCLPNPKHDPEEACNCFLVILYENNKIEHNHTIHPLPPLINPDDKKREFEQYMQYVSQKVDGEVFDIKDFPGSYTPKRIISLYDGSASDGHADYLAGKALEDFYSRHGMRYELVKVIMYHLAAHEYVTTYFITFKARKTGADPEDDSLTTFQARVSFGGRYKVEHCAIKQTSST